jgi:hypothetical protein
VIAHGVSPVSRRVTPSILAWTSVASNALQPPVRSREQHAEPGLNPFVHLRHGGERVIERRDVGARPRRYESAIPS